MRSVHTDTPPLLRSARTPAHSANRLARQSSKFPREGGPGALGAQEHRSTGAQEQVFQDTHPHPDTPNPSWCSLPCQSWNFAVAIRRPGRSKGPNGQPTLSGCQAYPIYPHVTSGRRRPANLRRPNDRLSIYLTLLLSTISSLILFATPGPSILGFCFAFFQPFF